MKKTDLKLIAEFVDLNAEAFSSFLEELKAIDAGEGDFILEDLFEMIDGMEEESK